MDHIDESRTMLCKVIFTTSETTQNRSSARNITWKQRNISQTSTKKMNALPNKTIFYGKTKVDVFACSLLQTA